MNFLSVMISIYFILRDSTKNYTQACGMATKNNVLHKILKLSYTISSQVV